MEIKILDGDFSICKVKDFSEVNPDGEYCFIGKTDEENSLVCLTSDIPNNVIEHDDHWKAFRIQGILDFSLIGILAQISTLLAEKQIGIFVVSTFNTDYILTKKDDFQKATTALSSAGYSIV